MPDLTPEEIEAKIKAIQEKDEAELKERNKVLEPLALDVLTLITANRPDLSSVDYADLKKNYTPIFTDTMNLLLEHNLKLDEIPYLFKIIRQAVDILDQQVTVSLNHNLGLAETKLWGGVRPKDRSLRDLDSVLKLKVDQA